jgi:hypothetical protein
LRRAPERQAPKHTPEVIGDRLATSRGIAQRIVGLVEHGALYAEHRGVGNSTVQVLLRRNAQHNKVARHLGLRKPSARFQAGVANLDDLVGERDVATNQSVAIK